MIVRLIVTCANCGDEAFKEVNHIDNEIPVEVDVIEFEQSDFFCDTCEQTTVTGDFDSIMDAREL